ncbi:transmembrane protein 131 isoform X2 [Centruroides vittatus]|uniref:transmembrane protein 131 isoform X2 n=1 Tax=Centruroides vittatus TaxID=120091 RepID=UPI00350FEF80
MARTYSLQFQCHKMKPYKLFRFVLLCNVLETVYKVVQALDGHTHAFIQTDGELGYLVDGVSIQMHQPLSADATTVSFTDLEDETLKTYESPIVFEPPSLDFHSHPVGMPHMEHVVVRNLSPDTSIHMLSISGSTRHFHCSFFQEKVIPPGGNTTFDVVFLARQEGSVENTLFIHTSLGSFKYQVIANGSPNPYRLHPFLGVRMPLNSSYTPIISMHNPHSLTLQLTEMYSSGGDLHLELPAGDSESPKHLWEIPPYETKSVMRANFVARIERNHTAYIRIKTNSTNHDYLVLPVEVEVTSVPGIYSPSEILEFGVLRSHDEPKTLTLSLLNSGQKHIHIVNVIVTPVNEAVEVKFNPVKIPPDTIWSTQVATITFFPSRALHPKQCSGKIVIKSKNNQFKLTIPYQVTLLRGFLDYNNSSTKFYVGQHSINNITYARQLNVTNNFNVTIVIHAVSLPDEAKPHFLANITHPVFLAPGETSSVIWLYFQPADKNLQLTTYLRLHTNISYFDIPLLCFSGKLQVFLPYGVNQSVIDFGTLGMGEKRTMIFAVINENPVDVNLKNWGSDMPKSYVDLVGLDKGNASTLAWRHNFSSLSKSFILKPNHYAIFRIEVIAPSDEGIFIKEAFVETQYEVIKVAFSLRTAKGSLKADSMFFQNAFPGKISSYSLHVYSTFSHPMTVTSVIPIPNDSRFYYDSLKSSLPVLYPETQSLIGKIFFDPRRECKQKCYSGLPTTTSMGHQWLLGMGLPSDVGDMDLELYKNLRQRWQAILDNGEKSMNLTFQLDTSEVRGFLLKARVSLQWPRLCNRCHLRFPITQIGNITIRDFTLENPSSLPVLIQIVPLALYPSPKTAIEMLSQRLGKDGNILKEADNNDHSAFILHDLEEYNPKPENPVPTYRKTLEEYFGVQSHRHTIAMLLTPGMRIRVHIGFAPKDDILKSSLILIRNNLTVMDALLVQGQGGYGQIKFGNKSPGANSSLMFELTDKHLKDCDGNKNNRFMQPNFTVRRAFTARNTGELPIYISGFYINGIPCEGYGFRILNCQGFELKPNASKKIDIAFTPDFTLFRVERMLQIHTSLGADHLIQFTLVATLPRHMLAPCMQALPRPYWEPIIYYSIVIFTIFMSIFVFIAAYLENDRILKSAFSSMITTTITTGSELKQEKGYLFDLKSIINSYNDHQLIGRIHGNNYLEGKRRHNSVESSLISNMDLSSGINHNQRRGSENNSLSKSKDCLSNISLKDIDLDLNDFNIKNKKKSQKYKHDCYSHGENESKKPQKTQSWTSFLKPNFSFRGGSIKTNNNSKPSVGTQTHKEHQKDNNIFKQSDDIDIINQKELSEMLSDNDNKSKSKQKIKDKNNDKNKLKRKNEVLVEEETSSTTTETSSPESDISEKDHRLPDICVTAKPIKSKRSKSKSCEHSRNLDTTLIHTKESIDCHDDGGFELSTKSKAHKKIKVDPTKVFGGDILRPSTLELPYRPKPIILSHENKENISQPDDSNNFCAKISSRSSVSKSKDEAFSELAHQTEAFALQHNLNNGKWCSNSHSLGNNTHSSTYSAVVSRDSRNIKGKIKTTIAQNGNDLKTSTNQTLKNAGLIGQRPSSLLLTTDSLSMNVNTSCVWNCNTPQMSPVITAGSPETPQDDGSADLLNWLAHPLPEQLSFTELPELPPISLKTDTFISNDSDSGFVDTFPSNASSPSWSQPMTVMQALQAERRQRIDEYHKQLALYNDWPGFDLPDVSESLWDQNYNPCVDSWSEKAPICDFVDNKAEEDAEKPLFIGNDSVWNTVGNNNWNSGPSVWQATAVNSCPTSTDIGVDILSNVNHSADEPNEEPICSSVENNENSPQLNNENGFDPFHALSSLWNPNLPTTETTPGSDVWSFSLFSQPPTTETGSSENKLNQEEQTKN